METDNQKLWQLVRDVHRHRRIQDVYAKCLLFMVDCLRAAERVLPERARRSLDVAERFCNGRASVAEVDAERERLWEYLQECDIAYSFEFRRARLLRATLCALYPKAPEDSDVYQLLEWFLQMYDPEGKRASTTLALLKLRFDPCASMSEHVVLP